ncbi:hypothetical protein OsI_29486 [Oryza sativa Indica Group]|uniref:Uncharacterized protein n=1 Tax=Oryza sativa subsp. indica TaxID=39946 RepID=A2YVY0_ORYSI|nr:hypothetical protein OsI_29486 [Oryza sativa Indica Group]
MANPGGNASGLAPHQQPNLNPNQQIPTVEQLMYAQVQMMHQMAETMRLIRQGQQGPQAAAPPRDKRGEFLKGLGEPLPLEFEYVEDFQEPDSQQQQQHFEEGKL